MAENIVEQLINSNDLWKHKRFVRYKDGAVLYSMSLNQFKKLAQDADAIYKYGKMVLVNTKIVDEYLEYFHVQMDEWENYGESAWLFGGQKVYYS